MSGVKEFEDVRWRGFDSALEFRHKVALAFITGGKVLDMGCGDGMLLSELKKKNSDVHGLDISSEAVKKCVARGIPATVFDFSTEVLPFTENSFDCVIMLDVLEHVYNPSELLASATKISNKFLVMSVPNFNSLPARLQVLFGRIPENNTPQKGHVYWFNYYELKQILRNTHLTIEEMKMNTVYESVPLIGSVMRALCRILPNVFALSFVVKVRKES